MGDCCGGRKGGGGKTSGGPPIWVNEVAAACKTGDVILTSNKDRGASLIQWATSTKWNHVGIVVKPSPNKAYIVEWGGGLFACDLVERLQEFAEWDTVDLAVRHLLIADAVDRRKIEERIEKFIDMLFREKLGQNRGIPMSNLYKAAQSMWDTKTSHGKSEIVEDDLKTLFCSKTVAVCLKAGGVLAPNRHADSFIPKHFSSDYNAFLDLQGGAHLGPEHRITFESRRMKDAVSNILKLPVIEVLAYGANAKAEEKAALLIEKFVRRLAARKELARRKASGKDTGKVALYKGAEEHGTKERVSLLKMLAGQPHKKPQDTLQLTWMDDEEELATGDGAKQMLI